MKKQALTREESMLLHLAARSISDDPSSLVYQKTDLSELDWKSVFAISKTQAVTLATFDAVTPYKEYIDKNIYDQWKMSAMAVLQSNCFVMKSQVELLEILNEGNFSYIILKGASASAYYPKGEIRALGDVDFLIDPKKKTDIENVLLKHGYLKSHDDHPNHLVFRKPKAHLEMHFEVAGIPYGWQGGLVRAFLKNALLETQLRWSDLNEFNAPSNMYHGLILLLHMQHHMLGEGLGIRHLCDWATYINETHKDAYWEEKLLPFLKKIGLFRYAVVMTKTCSIYLGSVCPDWAIETEEICAEVMQDVLLCGNFGLNDRQRSKGGMLISEHGKDGTRHGRFYYIFKILHRETKDLSLVKKCVIFYPFGYIWKIFWHIGRMITGKSKPLSVFIAAEERKTVYEKLRIFEPTE